MRMKKKVRRYFDTNVSSMLFTEHLSDGNKHVQDEAVWDRSRFDNNEGV